MGNESKGRQEETLASGEGGEVEMKVYSWRIASSTLRSRDFQANEVMSRGLKLQILLKDYGTVLGYDMGMIEEKEASQQAGGICC